MLPFRLCNLVDRSGRLPFQEFIGGSIQSVGFPVSCSGIGSAPVEKAFHYVLVGRALCVQCTNRRLYLIRNPIQSHCSDVFWV